RIELAISGIKMITAMCMVHIDENSPVVVQMCSGHADQRSCPRCHHEGTRLERFIEPSLLLLLREKPAHGYELMDRLAELYQGNVPDAGTVYRNLRRLEEAGAVISTWETGGSGPARRLYELTATGDELLAAWVITIQRHRDELNRFLDRYERR
ncbi:MAG: helix-turn-helix transcriptional regulator, partial [Firmicutes bacterium]|nr:helix-turn-helix transcriptional regulator [Bacillota bacterium]